MELFAPDPPTCPPGLIYVKDWLTSSEQNILFDEVESREFDTTLSRRVQHYGAKYNYDSSVVQEIGSAPAIPPELKKLGSRLVSDGYFKREPDQVIVNEYVGDQGIASHTDRDSFGEAIATISLIESWSMLFRGPLDEKIEVLLEKGSLAIMTGPSRHTWCHEIPKRKFEKQSGLTRSRGRRISLTYRTLNSTDGAHSG